MTGFVARTPFFYGLDEELKKIFDGELEVADIREAFLNVPKGFETGSNAMAVAPSRSADGHTRLMVNSHQPYTGPVAWYEARVKSQEGWDFLGSLFPGSPVLSHGAGPNLGWAHTVNKPDLVDVYQLTTDDPKKPTQYMFDGEWRDIEIMPIKFRVKLWGPFSLPVKRQAMRTAHGPAFVTDHGVFAVSYGGGSDIRSVEQWYRMNKAQNFDEWRSAMEMLAIPSLNSVYADKDGNIGYFYNIAIPVRAPGPDWRKILPGDTSKYLWQGVRNFADAPQVINPASGYVVNANHSPFKASGEGDNPDPSAYPDHYGVTIRTPNRGYRLQALYGADDSITGKEFLEYKFDTFYDPQSRVMKLAKRLIESPEANADETLTDELDLLRGWDGATTIDNRAAALGAFTAQKAHGFYINQDGLSIEDAIAALKETSAALEKGFGRIDPLWGDVARMRRGSIDMPINGGPDIVRAVWLTGDPEDGKMEIGGGDTSIVYADWAPTGEAVIKSIHQFGSATLDATSPHYDDQVEIFVNQEWRDPPMELDALLAEATRDYRPGRE